MYSASNLKPVVEKIKALPKPENRPVLIAISGFGGSGKTTIAEALAKLLDSSYVIHIDDFIAKEKVLKDPFDKGAFDRDRLEKQVLVPASQGKPARFQKFLWADNKLSNFHQVPAVDYLIVEGISVYHPNIAAYYDLRIWVDVDLDIAAERGQNRDRGNENERMWDFWKDNDQKYSDKYQPREHADIIISNQSENK